MIRSFEFNCFCFGMQNLPGCDKQISVADRV